MINVKSIHIAFVKNHEQVTVFDDISLSVKEGEILSILGPSGCGKSTLMRSMAGLLKPNRGTVDYDGDRNLANCQYQKKIGIVFQEPHLLQWLNVRDNIALPLQIGKKQKIGKSEMEHIGWLLRVIKLEQWAKAFPRQLSSGMRQRVSIARALVNSPRMLFLDEPLSALDDSTRIKLSEELSLLLRQQRITTVLVTHNIEEAFLFSDRVLLLSPKPATIVKQYEVTWDSERNSQLLQQPEFQEQVASCRQFILQQLPA